ncbi:MAG: translation initiation factor IF-2 N-terminal domain-containing protein, partial [Oscillospiraceae bacterium]
MVIKYRVHEVAKDFDKPSKDIIDLLAKYFDDQKKHMTVLEDNELNIIFEHYTQNNQVESFDEYFAAQPKEKAQPQVDKLPGENKAQPVQNAASNNQQTKTQQPQKQSDPHPFKKAEEKTEQKPRQARTKGTA